jgi:hypothetical protein
MLSKSQQARLEKVLTDAFRNELINMRDDKQISQDDMMFVYEKSHISISLPKTLEQRQIEYLERVGT